METNLDKIRAYYASFDEWGRLDAPEGTRELTRALEILSDRLALGARVLDLGGGPGRYALVLVEKAPSSCEGPARARYGQGFAASRLIGVTGV